MRRAAIALAVLAALAALVVWRARAPHGRRPIAPPRWALGDGPPPGSPPTGPALAGRVSDLRGRPVAGARVVARPERPGDGSAGLSVAGTDVDGRFELHLSPGRWRLVVDADGYETAELRGLEPPDATVEVVLARRLALDGVVRLDGRPAVGAAIQVGGLVQASVTSDAAGRFHLPRLIEGRYALRAHSADGSAAAYLPSIAVGEEPDGGARPLEIALAPAATVRGVVRDGAGRPIGGAEVALAESVLTPLPMAARADARGEFALPSVLPGGYLVSARAEGYVPAPAAAVTVPAPQPIVVRLERGGSVEGVVVDGEGRPLPGAAIEVAGESGGSPLAVGAEGVTVEARAARLEPGGELGILRGPIPFPPAVPRAGGQAPRALTSDGAGRFRVVGLPAGRLVVVASHPEFARGASEPFTSAAGAVATVQVVLQRGTTLRGRVLDERDQPLSGVEILDGDGRTQTFTDAHGEFALAHLVRAQTLTARRPGFVTAARAVRLDEREPIEIKLARAEGRIEGLVIDDRGFPVVGARVEVSGPMERPPRRLVSDGAGRFRADGLGPGPYRIAVDHADFVSAAIDGLAAGEEARVQLQPGGGVEGELRDARTGEVPAGARVELRVAGRTVPVPLQQGRFRVTALEAGPATLQASAPGYAPGSRAIEIPPGDRPRDVTLRDLVVELERGGVIVGEVRDADGDPAAGAEVGAGAARTVSDARGQFRLDGVAAGQVRVRADRAGLHADEDVEVRANDESRVELRLR
jgi:protocatechuate 3,4-dioxygenase beta subunit